MTGIVNSTGSRSGVIGTTVGAPTATGTITSGTWEGTDVAVAHGGTGASTHTANNVLIGAGASAITSVAPSTSGNLLTSNGSAWTSAAAPGSVAGENYFFFQAATAWQHFTTPSDNNALLVFNALTVAATGASLSPNRFTAPADGIYLFGANIYCVDSGGGSSVDAFFAFYKNGSLLGMTSDDTMHGIVSANNYHQLSFSQVLALDEDDYVAVHTPRGGSFYGGHSSWWGCRLK